MLKLVCCILFVVFTLSSVGGVPSQLNTKKQDQVASKLLLALRQLIQVREENGTTAAVGRNSANGAGQTRVGSVAGNVPNDAQIEEVLYGEDDDEDRVVEEIVEEFRDFIYKQVDKLRRKEGEEEEEEQGAQEPGRAPESLKRGLKPKDSVRGKVIKQLTGLYRTFLESEDDEIEEFEEEIIEPKDETRRSIMNSRHAKRTAKDQTGKTTPVGGDAESAGEIAAEREEIITWMTDNFKKFLIKDYEAVIATANQDSYQRI